MADWEAPTQVDVAHGQPAKSAARKPLGPGLPVGHYELIRPLGKGGMGEVWLARDTRLGRLVAIKFLLEHSGPAVDRFIVEARTTAQCRHENIVVIYDVNEFEAVPYMVLEYIQGRSLREAIFERGKDISANAVDIMIRVVKALECAHAMGIVHRDLKPENILLADTGQIKVVDFGIAKQVVPELASTLPGQGRTGADMSMTQDGLIVGTMPYMSPEQWSDFPIDARTDIWAVGIILFELIAGKHPLDPVTIAQLSQVTDLRIPMPRLEDKDAVRIGLTDVVDRCLKKRANERWSSAEELAAALEKLDEHKRIATVRDEHQSPFTGLSAFQKSDATRFFGRDEDISAALAKLRSQQLVVVVGPSGAGKSSFVRAGVLPALEHSGRTCESFILRPGKQPLAALADVLASVQDTGSFSGDEMEPETIAKTLRAQPGLLGAKLRSRCRVQGVDHCIVVVDQLEELYTQGIEMEDRTAFFACLAGIADDASSPLRVMATIRADFLDCVAEDRRFWREVMRGLILLPPMTMEGLRDALVKPLEVVGYRFDDEMIVGEILEGLKGTTTPLPVLQFAAAKLWERRDPERRLLTREAYRSFGGVAGAMATHADAVLAGLSLREQQLARTILVTLVTPERTRALVRLDELTKLAADSALVEQVVQHLADARLLAMATTGEREGKTVELIHESLIQKWPLFARWLDQEKDDAQFVSRVRTAAKEWDASGRPEGLLWRGESAEEARRHWKLHAEQATNEWSPRDVQFVEAVVLLSEREKHVRRRALGVVIAALGIVAIVVSILALRAKQEAIRANQEATRANQEAIRANQETIQSEKAKIEADRNASRARNATRMAVAREHQDDPTIGFALLREIEPQSTPRGWRDLLVAARYGGVAKTVFLHEDGVRDAQFSPDGKRIVSACMDGNVRIWNADGSGEPLILRGHEEWVWSVAFSRDGKRIASASHDNTIRIWNADGSGRPIILRGHEADVNEAAFSPDGTHIVSASSDRTVRVWNADGTGTPTILRGHDEVVYSAVFHPNGQQVISGAYDKTIRIWNADGSGNATVLRGHDDHIYAVAVSADGKHIASASEDKTVRVWNADGEGDPVILRGHEGEVYGVAFSPDGKRIASASQDKTVRLWNTDGSRYERIIHAHSGNANRVAFSSDGKLILSASYDQSVRVWNVDDEFEPHSLHPNGGGVYEAAFSSNGRYVAACVADGSIVVWNPEATEQPRIFRGHEGAVIAVAWSPDDRHIVSGGKDNTLRIWDVAGNDKPIVLHGHDGFVEYLAWSHDGKRIVSGSIDETIRIWTLNNDDKPLVLRGHGGEVTSVAFSRDGRRILSASTDRTVRLWNSDGSGQLLVIPHDISVNGAAFSPDEKYIVSAGHDGFLRIWNADGSDKPLLLRAYDDEQPWIQRQGAFSPDGKRFVTSSESAVRIWNIDGSGEPLTMHIPKGSVNMASFHPSGNSILVASRDGTIAILRITEPYTGPDDPRLWSTTSYCMPLDLRQRLLDFPEAQSRADLERCQKKILRSPD